MRVKLISTGVHAPWQKDEIVTVQVVELVPATEEIEAYYEVETIETYAPDLKAQHAKALQDQADTLHAAHGAAMQQIREEFAITVPTPTTGGIK